MKCVILAGGSGTRFWPYSRYNNPKQLLNIIGDKSMLQMTIERLEKIGLDTTAEIFFSSPYVLKVLGLEHKSQVDHENRTSNEEVIGDEWWEEGYKVKSESKSSDNTDTGDLCGHPGCENTVSAFDFRCYTCRGRFCPQHVGPNINCQLCSD